MDSIVLLSAKFPVIISVIMLNGLNYMYSKVLKTQISFSEESVTVQC